MIRSIKQINTGLFLALAGFSVQAQDIQFTQKPFVSEKDILMNISECVVAFADVDGDNDQDLYLSGYNGEECITRLYRNSGGRNFQLIENVPFEPVSRSSAAFADIDGDGDQDLLLTGLKSKTHERIAHLYINDGKANFKLGKKMPFKGLDFSALAVADADGDGDQDVLVNGLDEMLKSTTRLYLNNGNGVFKEADAVFQGCARGAVAFSDIDGDDDQDILITGLNNHYSPIAKLYKNDGAGNFTVSGNNQLQGVHGSAVSFSDINGDNNADLFITGISKGSKVISNLYENDGNGNFVQVSGTSFTGLRDGDVSFGDVDGDGDNDLFISGYNQHSESVSLLYENDGNGIFRVDENCRFAGVGNSGVALSDIDGDKDLDIVIAGKNSQHKGVGLYENTLQVNESLTSGGVSGFEGENGLLIYPNPNKGDMVVELSNNTEGTYEVTDLSGQVVLGGNLNNRKCLNLRLDLPKGAYFFNVTDTEGKVSSGRFIKE